MSPKPPKHNQTEVLIKFQIDSSSKEAAEKLAPKKFSASVKKESKYISKKNFAWN